VLRCVSLCMCVCIGARETSRQRATCRGKCSRNRWFLLNRFQFFFKLGMLRNDLDAWLSTLYGRIKKPRAPGPGHVKGPPPFAKKKNVGTLKTRTHTQTPLGVYIYFLPTMCWI